jgi:hypothetical protein
MPVYVDRVRKRVHSAVAVDVEWRREDRPVGQWRDARGDCGIRRDIGVELAEAWRYHPGHAEQFAVDVDDIRERVYSAVAVDIERLGVATARNRDAHQHRHDASAQIVRRNSHGN